MLNNSLPLLSSIYADSELIIAAEPAKKISVWFDNTLSMSEQLNSIYKTAFCYLHNLATVRKFLQGMGWGFDIFQKFAVCTLLSNMPRQNPRKAQ